MELTQKEGPISMGLKGIWYQIAQLGALFVILVVFYQDRHAALNQAKEDRTMFREELGAQRQIHDKRIGSLESAIRELTQEIKNAKVIP